MFSVPITISPTVVIECFTGFCHIYAEQLYNEGYSCCFYLFFTHEVTYKYVPFTYVVLTFTSTRFTLV